MTAAAPTNALSLVAAEIVVLLDPVRRVLEDSSPPHELMRLLRNAGWTLPGIGSVDLDALEGDLQSVVDAIGGLPAAVRSRSLPDVVESLDATAEAFQRLRELEEAFDGLLGLLHLDPPPGTGAALAADVAELLVLSWLSRRHARAFGLLQAVNVVRREARPAVAGGDGVVLRSAAPGLHLDLAALPSFLNDPIGTLRAAIAYSGLRASRDAQALALVLGSRARRMMGALGGGVSVWPPWSWLQELPEDERDAAGRTVMLWLGLPTPDGLPVASDLSVAFEVLSPADRGQLGQSGPGVEVRPAGLASLSAGRGPWTVDLEVEATVDAVFVGPETVAGADGGTLSATAGLTYTPDGPVVLGGQSGTRLELGVPSVGLGVELVDEPDLSFELELNGVRLVVGPGDGDSFVAAALSGVELDASFDLGLAWSKRAGLRLSAGDTGLELRVPIGRDLGGLVELEWVDVALLVGDTLELDLGAAATVTLGPFAARLEGVGLRVVAAFPPVHDGNVGPVDLSLAFKPPTGVAFDLDLGELGQGGGFVDHDPELGRYTGALALELLAVGLGAIVVIDTQLPDDPNGWALFASVSAAFPSLPLGFGFFLSGVGGIVCLNRTMDGEALAEGLKSRGVDAILFPDDPVADAALIVSQLDGWFPLAEGSTVFGVAATITWGTPKALVTGQLGVMLSFPELEIALLGSVSMALPDEQTAELELHMDVLGAIDPSEGTVSITASLYDSSLLRTIQLSGDMAMYASFGDEPYFLLAIGGFHPAFEPPSFLPASVTELRRVSYEVALGEDVWFGIAGYVAATSNTLQFGAEATLQASAEFLLATYQATGSLGFDVLLVFSPFAFVADAHASVEVSAGGAELIAAELQVHLEGPSPWYATAYGHFDFLGIDVRFDVAFGGAAGAETPPRINVRDAVVAAFELLVAWSAVSPGVQTIVLADDDADDDVLRASPDAELQARQSTAPLERELDVYGAYAIDGPTLLHVDGGIDGVARATTEPIDDWFAPAQFDTMTRTEKLSAPSYEEMTAGLLIGAGSVVTGADVLTVTPDPEVRILDPNATRPLGRVAFDSPLGAATAGLLTWRAQRPRRVTSPRLAIGVPSWTRVDAVSGEAVGKPGTYSAQLRTLRARRAVDPGARIAPSSAPRAAA